MENTMCLTFKLVVPHKFNPLLNDLLDNSKLELDKMLTNRDQNTTKYYKSIPSALARGLVSKYQRNKKLKEVKNVVLPICGDKGRVVKIVENGLRIPTIFKKEVIPCVFHKDMVGHIRQVEFFKRDGVWYMSYSFNVNTKETILNGTFIGVDRNSVGNVATIALPDNTTKKLGPCVSGITKQFRNRRAKLQSKGRKNALKKLKLKQSRRVKDINHKVSRAIVDHAIKHCSVIVLEDLGKLSSKKSKIQRYVQKSQWSFFQLETFIKYKAALHGIPIGYVSASYTSQICNKCGSINKPNGKTYKCNCGHVAHRDSNAALNIRDRMIEQSKGLSDSLLGHIDIPLNGIDRALSKSESSDGVR